MAENKETKSTSSSNTTKLEIVGPYDNTKGSQVFRFYRDDEKKGYIDLIPGQVLSVGTDVTKTESERLLNNEAWEIKKK